MDERYQKAESLKREVRVVDESTFVVPSQSRSNKAHIVECRFVCTCEDYRYRGNKCKHIIAVELAQKDGRI